MHGNGGYILLTLLLVVFVLGSSLMLGSFNNRLPASLAQDDALLRDMQAAKAALLFHTAKTPQLYNNTIGPGYLPCPDEDNDGEADSDSAVTCTTTGLGRLPQSVELPGTGNFFALSDAYAESDQKFWYAVASEHIYNGTHAPADGKTSATAERLSLNGKPRYVALIIAPGPALPGQSRTPNSDEQFVPGNYLEGANSNGDTLYETSGDDPDSFNDRILGISHDELMRYAGMSVAQAIKDTLDPACLASGAACPPWFESERWTDHIIYDDSYDGSGLPSTVTFVGCPGISFILNDADTAVMQGGDKCEL